MNEVFKRVVAEAKADIAAGRMTNDKWDRLSGKQREAARDLSGLHPSLVGREGWRIEVEYNEPTSPLCIANFSKTDANGHVTRERFRVGRSTGWKPCSLALFNARSMGGDPVPGDVKFRVLAWIGS